ncbi:MAG: class I SAM-dependent methyltransferase [Edaphobacter sp.]
MTAARNPVTQIGKDILSLSLASVIRMSLGGLKEGRKSLKDTYRAVSPFSPLRVGAGRKMLELIPVASLETLGGMPEQITLDMRFVDVDGATPFRDLIAILSLAKSQRPKAVLEFGTYFGSTTANLALNLPEATIHTIDLPEDAVEASALVEGQPVDDFHLIRGRQLGKSFRGTPLEQRIVQHQGDTAKYDYGVIREPVTVFLVDGSHTYEYARSDTMRCFGIARGQSTFMWHDCDQNCLGVTTWLAELIRAGLPVVRVENTSLACMRINARDVRVQKMLRS